MNWNGRKVLLTGGASFIGSHLFDALVARGAVVRVVDDLSSGRLESIRRHLEAGRVEFVHENEPIVHRPGEALDCFLRTQMDVLVLGRAVIEKGGLPRHLTRGRECQIALTIG